MQGSFRFGGCPMPSFLTYGESLKSVVWDFRISTICRSAKKYLHLEKLTPAVLNDLVKAVYVHAPDNSSGHRVQDVEISYNYIGILPATLLYDLQNGKTA